MSFTRRAVELPPEPILIVALEGWIDPGFAAQNALVAMLAQIKTRSLAIFNGDDLIDHRARRPSAIIRDGARTDAIYGAPRLRVGRDLEGRGVAFLVGPEPDYRWRPFCHEVTTLATELGCTLVVGLGAFPAAVPHTRPILLTTTASSAALARRVGFQPGYIEVPAGIGDAIGTYCSDAGIPSVGIWARVPHYVGAMAYAPASLALVEGLVELTGLTFELDPLRSDADQGRNHVDELIAQSEEHTEMVRQLEEQYAEDEAEAGRPIDEADVAGADELISELERYLRDEGA